MSLLTANTLIKMPMCILNKLHTRVLSVYVSNAYDVWSPKALILEEEENGLRAHEGELPIKNFVLLPQYHCIAINNKLIHRPLVDPTQCCV